MRQLRTILRLRLQAKLNLRQIKTSLRLSLGAVQKICSKAETFDLDWPAIEELDDQQLASRFYPQADTRVSSAFQLPDWSEVYRELKRKGMTKLLLWEEYTQQYPNHCYSYPQYCMLYQQWQKKQKRSMRQHHKAGGKLFVDYAVQTVPVVQQDTGEIQFAQIFVAVLGASNYTYAEATWSQRLPDWIGIHVRTFEFIKVVPVLLIPDNLNKHIHGQLEEVNNNPFKQLKGTRQQWFDSLDKPALLPQPKQAFEFTEIKTVKVNVDYHIQFDGHLYSVPHHLVGEKLELYAKAFLIEMYFHNRCICQHVRQYHSGTTTVPAHMPGRHKKHHHGHQGD